MSSLSFALCLCVCVCIVSPPSLHNHQSSRDPPYLRVLYLKSKSFPPSHPFPHLLVVVCTLRKSLMPVGGWCFFCTVLLHVTLAFLFFVAFLGKAKDKKCYFRLRLQSAVWHNFCLLIPPFLFVFLFVCVRFYALRSNHGGEKHQFYDHTTHTYTSSDRERPSNDLI